MLDIKKLELVIWPIINPNLISKKRENIKDEIVNFEIRAINVNKLGFTG